MSKAINSTLHIDEVVDMLLEQTAKLMKAVILTASLLSMLVMTTPVLAVEAHHPESQSAPAEARMNTEKMDASVQKMQEMRKKIETEKTRPPGKNSCTNTWG